MSRAIGVCIEQIGLGCEHCGSTELSFLLAAHPTLSWGSEQAHGFFTRDDFSQKTELFSRDALVTYIYMREFTFSPRTDTLGFDFDPGYFGPEGDSYDLPGRVRALLPRARFVVLLRDPEDPVTWDDTLPNDLRHDLGVRNESDIAAKAECNWVRRLRLWLKAFPRERFFFARYDDVAGDVWRRARLLAEVAFFLGLPVHKYPLDVLRRDYRSAIGGAANNSWWHSHRRRYSALNATTMPAFSRRCHEGLTELVGRDLWPPKPPTRAAAERDLELRANATRLIAFPDPEREEKIQRRLDKYGSSAAAAAAGQQRVDPSYRNPEQSGILAEVSNRAAGIPPRSRRNPRRNGRSATTAQTHGPQHHQGHVPKDQAKHHGKKKNSEKSKGPQTLRASSLGEGRKKGHS